MRNHFGNLNSFSKIIIIVLVILLTLLISMIIGSVIAIPFFGFDSIFKILGTSNDFSEDNTAFLKYLQLVQSVGMFILPSLVIAYLFGDSVTDYLKLNKMPIWRSIIIAVILILVSNPIINYASEINSRLTLPESMASLENWLKTTEEAAANITKLFLMTNSFGGLLFNIFLIALIPAIGEEFLFRGIIQRLFYESTRNHHLSVWISAILFSALHFQFYGFIPRAILGAMFGYLFVISGNLWLPVASHFFNNAVAVIAYYLYGEGILNVDPEKIGVDSKYKLLTLFSVFIVIMLFVLIDRIEKRKNQKLIVD